MSDRLISVGLDVGTTTTQLIVLELTVQNQASGFAVPQMEITERKIRYKSPVYFTPMTDGYHVDGKAIADIVDNEYRKANITREGVDTGAVIITGETSRKENAKAVLEALSDFAGDFVVATAGPDLESVLAAKGAGAVAYSERTGKRVLHMDIGGGTSNLALIEEGRIVQTGCLNVGGRLIKLDRSGRLTYVSEVLREMTPLRPADMPDTEHLRAVAQMLVRTLETAAGLRQEEELLQRLLTKEASGVWEKPGQAVLSFSGGVADCIDTEHAPDAFGDIGPLLGQEIKKSLLCKGEYMLGTETIRATVIGAGCHSAQLSGSTVFHRGVQLPVKNLPVVVFTEKEQNGPAFSEQIARRIAQKDSQTVVLAIPGYAAPNYSQVAYLAEAIVRGTAGKSVYVCLESDMAKALGHMLCLQIGQDTPCLCIDRLQLQEESFLDIGVPVGPALPVVIKTLILSK